MSEYYTYTSEAFGSLFIKNLTPTAKALTIDKEIPIILAKKSSSISGTFFRMHKKTNFIIVKLVKIKMTETQQKPLIIIPNVQT